MSIHITNVHKSAGHTLVELMIAGALSSLVVIGSMVGYSYAGRMTRSGGYQVQFTAMARATAQQIGRHVEGGRAIGVVSNEIINIVTADMRRSRIYYDSQNREILFQRDVAANSVPQVLCTHVSRVVKQNGQVVPIFEIVPTSPSAVRVVFHVGDSLDPASAGVYSETGYGYQGQEIRISVSPRNLQRWYD